MTCKTIMILAITCVAICVIPFVAMAGPVDDLVARMPALNIDEGNKVFSEMVGLGQTGIRRLCSQLTPPGVGDDTKARFALSGLAKYVSRDGAEAERKVFAPALIKSLDGAADKEVKAFLIRQLQLAGKDESVGPLSKLLTDNELCEPATQALQAIQSDSAASALSEALPSVNGKNQITIITALGNLRVQAAAKQLLDYATSTDKNTRWAAMFALANIGDPSAERILTKALRTDSNYDKAKATSYLLLLSRRLAEAGQKDHCAKICRRLIKTRTAAKENNVPCAALSTLITALGSDALDDLLAALDGKNVYLRKTALELAQKIPGEATAAKLVARMKQASPAAQVMMIRMFAGRNDRTSRQALLNALRDTDKNVRLTAVSATKKLQGREVVTHLLGVMRSGNAEDVQAVKSALLLRSGNNFLAEVAGSLEKMPANAQAALLEVLAARRAKSQIAVVFHFTKSENDVVRLTAIQALNNLVTAGDLERLVHLMLKVHIAAERTAAQKAVITAAQQFDDRDKATELLRKTLKNSNAVTKLSLLSVLAKIGGGQALSAVSAEMKSSDTSVSNASVRALADWPDDAAVDELFKIVCETKQLKQQVLALRGLIRLLPTAQISLNDKLWKYHIAIKSLQRPDEKKLILATLADIRHERALKFVAPWLDDKVLQNEACQAAVKIACPQKKGQKGLEGLDVQLILQKVVAVCSNANLRKQADDYLKTMPKSTLNQPPAGFVALFNGKDLTGWKGLLARPNDNPIKRKALSPEQLAVEQAKADKKMRDNWKVDKDGVLEFDGKGFSLATTRDYGNFEMLVDWKIVDPHGDSGIYLRGTPQIQIWDPGKPRNKGIGSGGLFNNKRNSSKPLVTADNPIGQWSTFRIRMIGEHVTVHLNDELVVDNIVQENYWDRSKPVFPSEQIELQCHGNPIHFRNIFIREITAESDWQLLFNGKDLTGWKGDTKGYTVENGTIICKQGRNLFTVDEFDNFILQFEFKLTTGANSGLGIRTPYPSRAAYDAMELQILDDSAKRYRNLKPYQFHGSIYGVVPAKRGRLRPLGQWNYQEVIARGPHIVINLNGNMIVDADIDKASANGTMDGKEHPGLKRKKGHIAFLGHRTHVEFRSIRIKELK